MGILKNKNVVISFEGNAISVAYCSLKKGVAYIDDAFMLKDEQLDEFLSKEKTKSFIVVTSFKDFHQDTLLLPPAGDKLLEKMVGVEVRKKAQFKDPSIIYQVLGEKIADNKKMQEVFVFAVSANEINHIAERFVRNGKHISAIYHDIFAVASQINIADQPVLCVSGTGLTKSLFLVRGGSVSFIRTAQSIESGMNDFDIQNVNLTLSYCKQNFKTTPAMVMLTGGLCNDYKATAVATEPIACLPFTAKIGKLKQSVLDYTTHTAAFMAHKGKGNINLLTEQLRKFFNIKKYLKYSTVTLLLFASAGLFYDVYTIGQVLKVKNIINDKKITPADINSALSMHNGRKTELLKYRPFINSALDTYKAPEAYKFLALMSGVKTDGVRISAISVNINTGGGIEATIKGITKSDGYAAMQSDYERFVASVTAMKGIVVGKHDIDFKDKSLYIDLKWSEL